MTQQPIIVLGAARSGTKLLRGLIAASQQYRLIEYDVNFIWRQGNADVPHDALPAERASHGILRRIHRQLDRCAAAIPGTREQTPFVEKTVSNILRIPFVYRAYPDAKYIFLVRDGRDVVESAERCWREPPQFGYVLRKAMAFPRLLCSRYAASYGGSVMRRAIGAAKQVSTWGPKYPGMDEDARRLPLTEVCCRQWSACIESYEANRSIFASSQLLEVRYEDLVNAAEDQVRRLYDFLGIPTDVASRREIASVIQTGNVGKHHRLDSEKRRRIEDAVGPSLARWNYN